MHVEEVGSGPRVVLVHGSVAAGWATWAEQRTLADRFTLVVVTRGGYPPNPPLARIDFTEQAVELADLFEPGDHLVGHSYGGVVSLLAAARRPAALRTLTVVEPPAFGLARGEPSVDRAIEELRRFRVGAPYTPRAYLELFLPWVGSKLQLADPLPAQLELGARAAMRERPPDEAEIPLERLAAAPFRKLVVSGAHAAMFEAVCDALERGLDAERAVVGGAGHSIPRAGRPFNERLAEFLLA